MEIPQEAIEAAVFTAMKYDFEIEFRCTLNPLNLRLIPKVQAFKLMGNAILSFNFLLFYLQFNFYYPYNGHLDSPVIQYEENGLDQEITND